MRDGADRHAQGEQRQRHDEAGAVPAVRAVHQGRVRGGEGAQGLRELGAGFREGEEAEPGQAQGLHYLLAEDADGGDAEVEDVEDY